MNKLDFEGRVAVVTGGAQGIGLAVAQRLVASGARVCVWDVTQQHLDEARAVLGTAAQAIRVDVTSEREVEDAAKATAQAHGKIDVLVCSAGNPHIAGAP
jgi:3-oxoacyl-[acyl-carrier protein] reductase